MFQMVQFLVPSGPKRPGNTSVSQPAGRIRTQAAHEEFLQHVRTVSGLRQQDMFCSRRVPNESETGRDEISLVLLTGHGVLCIDLKTWSGSASVRVRSQQQNLSSVSAEQLPDALQAITVKARNLCSHMTRCGLKVRPSLFIPRVLLLSADCEVRDERLVSGAEVRDERLVSGAEVRDERLVSGAEVRDERLVSGAEVQAFLCSLRGGYVSWLSDAFTPAWISGHLSYGQMRALREHLELMGSWDLLLLSDGQELSGDLQSCRHLALNRLDTEQLEFSRAGSLITDTLWRLLGHTPQVTVSMYKRGAQGWLGKPLIATATIPSSTCVIFRIRGETADATIPAGSIRSVTLSI